MRLPKEVKLEFDSAVSDKKPHKLSVFLFVYGKSAEDVAAEAAAKLQDTAAWLERVAAIGAHAPERPRPIPIDPRPGPSGC